MSVSRFIGALSVFLMSASLVACQTSGRSTALNLIHDADASRLAGDFATSLINYSKAIRSGELEIAELGHSYKSRGIVKSHINDNLGALEDLKGALVYTPNDTKVWSSICLQYFRLKQYDPAMLACKKATDLAPNDLSANGIRGLVWAGKGDFGKAIADLTSAVEFEPDNLVHRANRASVYIEMGRKMDARRDVQHVLKNGPGWLKSAPGFLDVMKKAGMI